MVMEKTEKVAAGGVQELHVLAVDDSHVDRKVIERLLKISACKGWFFEAFISFSFFLFL